MGVSNSAQPVWEYPQIVCPLIIDYTCMLPTIRTGNDDLGRVSQSNATVIIAILLDANRKKTAIVSLLPLFHAGKQSAHGSILEINEVAFVRV